MKVKTWIYFLLIEIFHLLNKKFFKLHFQQGKSLSQIAKELGICRERVRQTKQLLLRKIKI
ncbi:MAG TPA: hypothetical protein ENI51_06270, partial [Candidatus Atribacteria bacterium]|nr:hypothetical protein [Candidatus Atribacteria bacterium]